MKHLLKCLAAAVLAIGLTAASVQEADAGNSGKVIAGAIIGGLVLGAMAHQNNRRGYYGHYGYRDRPYIRYDDYAYEGEYCYRGPKQCSFRRECRRDRYGDRRCTKRRHCYRPVYCE